MTLCKLVQAPVQILFSTPYDLAYEVMPPKSSYKILKTPVVQNCPQWVDPCRSISVPRPAGIGATASFVCTAAKREVHPSATASRAWTIGLGRPPKRSCGPCDRSEQRWSCDDTAIRSEPIKFPSAIRRRHQHLFYRRHAITLPVAAFQR